MDERFHPDATFRTGPGVANPAPGGAGFAARAGQLRVLLIEDDDGDAFLVQILRSYELHANAYVSKPVDFEGFIAAIRQIDDFFLTLVKLPA
jgi:hypothetical protein